MRLAGVPIPDADVLELARLLGTAGFADLAARLEDAWEVETKVIALTVPEREVILRALEEPPTMRSRSCEACCSESTSGGYARGSSKPGGAARIDPNVSYRARRVQDTLPSDGRGEAAPSLPLPPSSTCRMRTRRLT
jgi:hypothetical protein